MQYTVAHIHYGNQPYQRELVQQALADIGFEAFDGDDAYIQTSLLDEHLVAETLAGTDYTLEACPDENWNATWEAEHPIEELPLGVKIIPHCAFGAGHHETTRMMVDALIKPLSSFPFPQSASLRARGDSAGCVLDMGCGTGVLGIFAAKLGASCVLAVDIDEHSVANTLENAELNGIHATLLEPSESPLALSEAFWGKGKGERGFGFFVLCASSVPSGSYDLILANIHRNILLAQMADYARTLCAGGRLFLSGFYESDIEALISEAAKYGLRHVATHADGDWRMLIMSK